jgi:hypothetical protein
MFRVVWEIDVEAESPEGAAVKALEYQRDPESCATVFRVVAHDGSLGVDGRELDVDPETMTAYGYKETP